MSELPNNVLFEMENKNIAVQDWIPRDDFERLSPIAKSEIVKAGIVLRDTVTRRQYDRATSMDRAAFDRSGGRIVD